MRSTIQNMGKTALVVYMVTSAFLNGCQVKGKDFTATCPQKFVLAGIPGQVVSIIRNSDNKEMHYLASKYKITKMQWEGNTLKIEHPNKKRTVINMHSGSAQVSHANI